MPELGRLKEILSGPVVDPSRRPEGTKLASVLVIIYGQGPYVIMTERPKTMNNHAGEVSFPGGSWQGRDVDLLSTALRETREELGFAISPSDVIGQLESVTTLNSGFTIFPFIAIVEKIPEMKPNAEIESVLKIPLIPLLHTMGTDQNPAHRSIREMYTFQFQDYLIWGASARIMRQIYVRLSAGKMI
ncbi:MAG: CoA pyrophosphatase [Thaumarchaeota archaeon]|nr:CoA pyrophosphatase [Nitrososphaerota archaeon]